MLAGRRDSRLLPMAVWTTRWSTFLPTFFAHDHEHEGLRVQRWYIPCTAHARAPNPPLALDYGSACAYLFNYWHALATKVTLSPVWIVWWRSAEGHCVAGTAAVDRSSVRSSGFKSDGAACQVSCVVKRLGSV